MFSDGLTVCFLLAEWQRDITPQREQFRAGKRRKTVPSKIATIATVNLRRVSAAPTTPSKIYNSETTTDKHLHHDMSPPEESGRTSYRKVHPCVFV